MKLNKYKKPDGSTYYAILPENIQDTFIISVPAYGIYQRSQININIPANLTARRTIEYNWSSPVDIAILEGLLYSNNLIAEDRLTIFIHSGAVGIITANAVVGSNIIQVSNQFNFLLGASIKINTTEYTVLKYIDDDKLYISPALVENITAGTVISQKFYIFNNYEIINTTEPIKIGQESQNSLYFSKNFILSILIDASPSEARIIFGEVSYYILQIS